MKRTPIKRKTGLKRAGPMNRSPMKRARKVPRGQKPSLRDEYREANPKCEWAIHFPELEQHVGRATDMRQFMRPEVNHLWPRSNGDDWSGLITLSSYAHHEVFHADTIAGRILCMLVKCEKDEANLAFWRKASGKQIVSWVESLGQNYPVGHWLRPYWQRLVRKLESLQASERNQPFSIK